MAATARRLTVHGRVQGVFYRNWTVKSARGLGLTGWVRNRNDGTVEAHVEGETASLHNLIELMRDGPPAANVERIDVENAALCHGELFEKRD